MIRSVALTIVLLYTFSATYSQHLAHGADVSWLPEMEQSGRIFRDKDGNERPLLDILKDHCIDAVRLRVWVHPDRGLCGQEYVVALAQRAHDLGFRLMIDFHYSDWWADPLNQKIPASWQDLPIRGLEDSVYAHTFSVLSALKNAGITPEWVQIGNETNDGLLWETCRATVSMDNYARIVTAGDRAAHEVFPQVITIVHLGSGDDAGLYEWNIGGLVGLGAQFDAVGMSLYPEVKHWQTAAVKCFANMDAVIRRFGKPVMISEIGMPWQYPKESKDFVDYMLRNNRSFGAMGLGVFWWEPQSYGWQNYEKGAWGPDGRPTEALDGFLLDCPDR